jgi:hypothetical protein
MAWAISDEAILSAFDAERQSLDEPGFRRVSLPGMVLRLPDMQGEGFVSYSRHAASELDTAVPRAVRAFETAGCDFEWKAFAHDEPPDLAQRLSARGFALGAVEAGSAAADRSDRSLRRIRGPDPDCAGDSIGPWCVQDVCQQ